MKHFIKIAFSVTIVVLSVGALGGYEKADAYGECDQYGFMAMSDGLGSCRCMSGYSFGKDFMGQTSCISNTQLCQDEYGYNATSNYSGGCKCNYGYGFGKSYSGKTQCISLDSMCYDQLGYSSSYDSLTDSCKCSYGYIIDGNQCVSGNSFCRSENGLYSSYSTSSKSCECDSGYTLDDDRQCVKKQNNAYFMLLAIDESSDSIIVQSDYSKQNYLLEYGIGCGLYIDRYLDKNLVINLGTDFNIDMFDKIVLQDHSATCSIMSYDFTSDDSFEEKEDPIIYTAPTTKFNTTTTNNVVASVKPKPVLNRVDTEVKKEVTPPEVVKDEVEAEIPTQVNPEIPWYKKFFNWLF